jgi:hypothetical protein
MVTVTTAENALKNIYLDTVINDINKRTNPFLTMVEENAKAASGRNAKFSIRSGASAVGTGTETGDLPVIDGDKNVEVSVPLKNLYGTFQISDKALKAASIDPNAFASLLGGEMQNLVAAAQNHLASMLYGNGKKLLALFDKTNLSADRLVITLDARYIGNFSVGQDILITDSFGAKRSHPVNATTISAIDTALKKITLSTAMTNNKADRYYIYNTNDEGTCMNGIDTVFETNPYGIDLTANPELAPYKFDEPNAVIKVMNEDEVMSFFDKYEEHCQGMPADIILTAPVVKKALFESLRDTRANIATAELAGGFHGFTFNGIPVYSDIKCKSGVLYALNSKSWAMHQLCDWTWLAGEDGTILKQQPNKATYMATLVKYADLICDKPFLQGKAAGYSATAWK